ncbi:MAG: methyltransferase domain-containing protein [Monoraphidium minutum]|nr:MAG: methyltransferase domain-containing protein [Monoraphidium minutum]
MGRAALPLLALLLAAAVGRAAAMWHQCGAQAAHGGPYGNQAMANLSDFRMGLISSLWPYTIDVSRELTGWQRYDPFNPFISCPPHQPLRRVGSAADGGKIICDVSRLAPPCVIYSLGSRGDYTFEIDMLKLTQCEIHTFDCTYDGASIHPRHHYHKTCLGFPTQPLFEDYASITQRLGHTVVDFLKIDIEGHEPSVLQSLVSNKGHLPRQISMEMHMRDAVGAVAPNNTVQMGVLFYHMAVLGYGIISREDNLWGAHGCCAEFTFLHVEQLHRHHHLHSGRRRSASPRVRGSAWGTRRCRTRSARTSRRRGLFPWFSRISRGSRFSRPTRAASSPSAGGGGAACGRAGAAAAGARC